LMPRIQNERRPFRRQLLSDRASKSLTRGSHKRYLTLYSQVHLFLTEVVVGFIKPVLPGRAKNVDVECVLERLGSVRQVRWDDENFAGTHDQFFFAIVAEPKF